MIDLNPAHLIVDANVRKNVSLDADFLASVKEHGILVPILVMSEPGTDLYRVLDGQRRTLAAIDAGLTLIPTHQAENAAEADRIIRQLVINDQRTAIDDTDHSAALLQLDGLGVTADQIAKKTRIPKDRIQVALTVAKSPIASAAVATRQITLDDAAAITEFEDDPDVVEKLIQDAQRGYGLNHAIRTARNRRETATVRLAHAEQLTAKGTTIIDDVVKGRHYTFDQVESAKGGKVMMPNTIGKGLVAHITTVDEWNSTENRYIPKPKTTYLLEDPQTHGWVIKAGTPTESITDEEKAARRRVRENNKAWPLAVEVRHNWIRDNLLTRTSLPSDTITFIATALAGGHPSDGYNSGRRMAAAWLGLNYDAYAGVGFIGEFEKHPGRANLIATALACAAAETKIEAREAWRATSRDLTNAARYLEHLAAWGYELSDIESELITAGKAATK